MQLGERPLAVYPSAVLPSTSAKICTTESSRLRAVEGAARREASQPAVCCATLAKSLSLFVPQFSHLYDEGPPSWTICEE